VKIGFFDSGLGGLTVLDKAMRLMPDEDYIYYADEGHVPYGEKTTEEIIQFASSAVSFLEEQGCKAVVIACNTATSVAIEILRQRFSIPIIGIEPAVKPAVEHAGHRRILVMATPVTVRESKLRQLIASLDAEDTVDLLAMPGLVHFCEQEQFDGPEVRAYIAGRLEGKDTFAYSDLVLGCTHFNHFQTALSSFFPDSLQISDGSMGTVRQLQSILEQKSLRGGGNGLMELYVTDGEPASAEICARAQRLLQRLKTIEV